MDIDKRESSNSLFIAIALLTVPHIHTRVHNFIHYNFYISCAISCESFEAKKPWHSHEMMKLNFFFHSEV